MERTRSRAINILISVTLQNMRCLLFTSGYECDVDVGEQPMVSFGIRAKRI